MGILFHIMWMDMLSSGGSYFLLSGGHDNLWDGEWTGLLGKDTLFCKNAFCCVTEEMYYGWWRFVTFLQLDCP